MPPFPPFVGRDGVLVVAHRGASRAARENTVEAYRRAGEMGAHAVELDVRRTADRRLVIHHDAEVPEVGVLCSLDAAEVRARAPWLPSFDEALAACEGMWVNVEIKNLPHDADYDPDEWVSAETARWVGEVGGHDRLLLSSFSPMVLSAVREVDASVCTGFVFGGYLDPLAAVEIAAEAGHVSVHPDLSTVADPAVAASVCAAAADAGLAVIPWVVNEPDDMRRLADAGVSGIFTDVPDVAVEVLRPR